MTDTKYRSIAELSSARRSAATAQLGLASGGSRLRYEDFTGGALAKMAHERTALYSALRDELHLRRTLLGALCGATATDATIEERFTAQRKHFKGTPQEAEFAERHKAWRDAVAAIERVTPFDGGPRAA
jgi:hypothetical protein